MAVFPLDPIAIYAKMENGKLWGTEVILIALARSATKACGVIRETQLVELTTILRPLNIK